MNWLKQLKGKLRRNEPLSRHTTFKIGGRAMLFIEPFDEADLKRIVINAGPKHIRILLMGSGSNILVNNAKIAGAVIRLSSPSFKRIIRRDKDLLEAGSGVTLTQLLNYARRSGLGGCEFLAGIPGTLGAALVMNAGVKDGRIGDLVRQVRVMDYKGNTRILNKGELQFTYRDSGLKKYIVLGALLKLAALGKKRISGRIKKRMEYRIRTQDYAYPSAGCVFKNPGNGVAAGRLIDMCGLKGTHIGDAYVGTKHANFILNKGKARASDVLKLMRYVKGKVKNKFGIELEHEIKIWR